MNWVEARKSMLEGKKVLFFHRDQLVPVAKDTSFKDLRWKYFGQFGLTCNDVFSGEYFLAKYVVKWKNDEKLFIDIHEATNFAESKARDEGFNSYVFGMENGVQKEEPFMSCQWEM
ncbi:MAG: hypothetical protein ABTA16_00240 [Niallia sp.]